MKKHTEPRKIIPERYTWNFTKNEIIKILLDHLKEKGIENLQFYQSCVEFKHVSNEHSFILYGDEILKEE